MTICNGLGHPIRVKHYGKLDYTPPKESVFMKYDLVIALVIAVLLYAIGLIAIW